MNFLWDFMICSGFEAKTLFLKNRGFAYKSDFVQIFVLILMQIFIDFVLFWVAFSLQKGVCIDIDFLIDLGGVFLRPFLGGSAKGALFNFFWEGWKFFSGSFWRAKKMKMPILGVQKTFKMGS